MNKLEQLRQAIDAVPAGYGGLWSTMSLLLSEGELGTLRAYVTGARTMALHLTSDEALLKALSDIKELLK
jgi:hypothetical protein